MIVELFRDSVRGVLALVFDDENVHEDPVLVIYDADSDPTTEAPEGSIVMTTDEMFAVGGQFLTQVNRLERMRRDIPQDLPPS